MEKPSNVYLLHTYLAVRAFQGCASWRGSRPARILHCERWAWTASAPGWFVGPEGRYAGRPRGRWGRNRWPRECVAKTIGPGAHLATKSVRDCRPRTCNSCICHADSCSGVRDSTELTCGHSYRCKLEKKGKIQLFKTMAGQVVFTVVTAINKRMKMECWKTTKYIEKDNNNKVKTYLTN